MISILNLALKDDKLSGYQVLDGNKLKFTGVRAPSLDKKRTAGVGQSH
jgi:hypothetical protein